MTASEIADSLANVQSLFMDAAPATQHRIVQALFEQVEVLGPNEVWLDPSIEAEARGWATAMSGEFRVEERKTGRRLKWGSPSRTQRPGPFLLINRTKPREAASGESSA